MKFKAVVLAGGRSTRFGGMHKPALEIGGITVLQHIVETLTETGMSLGVSPQIIVAGIADGLNSSARARVAVVREEPPFSGPLAGIAAGLAGLDTHDDGTVLLLAGDLPFMSAEALARVVSVSVAHNTVASPIDSEGYPQYLFSAWPEGLLRRRLAAQESIENQPVRRLFADVALVEVPLEARVIADIDSPEDLDRWQ